MFSNSCYDGEALTYNYYKWIKKLLGEVTVEIQDITKINYCGESRSYYGELRSYQEKLLWRIKKLPREVTVVNQEVTKKSYCGK